jgi:UDPglucose 6-dehydrogenase/GDP-mannose 6-dehydrogenase
MRVAVVGAGYVGLVSGVCLAETGHEVVCVDLNPARVAKILRGEPPIHEAGLEPLLRAHLGTRFRATQNLESAVRSSDLTLIAVGTSFDGTRIDLTHVRKAAEQIGLALRERADYHVVVVKSTVVPGTTDSVVRPLLERASGKRAGHDFGVGMNPEFLTEGQAVRDFLEPDRLVLGAEDDRVLAALEALYAAFPEVPKIRTNPRTAEMIKYASNALLATAISFSNEIANLCAALGQVDAVEVMKGLHASNYLSVTAPDGARREAPITSFLFPGCGFGGSCLPKDVSALAAHGEAAGVPMRLLRAIMTVNQEQARELLRQLERHFSALAGLRVAVVGLAFKPDTDDVRESPAFPIIRLLLERQAVVTAYDPVAMPPAREVLGDAIGYADSLESCLADVDAVVLVTRWKQFEVVPSLLRAMASPPLLVDGRRQLERRDVPRYAAIGL